MDVVEPVSTTTDDEDKKSTSMYVFIDNNSYCYIILNTAKLF